jgi:hypothetical protein
LRKRFHAVLSSSVVVEVSFDLSMRTVVPSEKRELMAYRQRNLVREARSVELRRILESLQLQSEEEDES